MSETLEEAVVELDEVLMGSVAGGLRGDAEPDG